MYGVRLGPLVVVCLCLLLRAPVASAQENPNLGRLFFCVSHAYTLMELIDAATDSVNSLGDELAILAGLDEQSATVGKIDLGMQVVLFRADEQADALDGCLDIVLAQPAEPANLVAAHLVPVLVINSLRALGPYREALATRDWIISAVLARGDPCGDASNGGFNYFRRFPNELEAKLTSLRAKGTDLAARHRDAAKEERGGQGKTR